MSLLHSRPARRRPRPLSASLALMVLLTSCHAPTPAVTEAPSEAASLPLDALAGADELRALLPGVGTVGLPLEGTWADRPAWRYDLDGSGSGYRLRDTGELWHQPEDGPAIRLTDGAGDLRPDDSLVLPAPTQLDLQPDGLSAALFDAAWGVMPHDGGDLVLTRVRVMGRYISGDTTYHLCWLWTDWYYDFLLERGANQGGGEDYAVIPLREDPDVSGRYRLAGDVVRGGDDQTMGQFFQSHGAPADLCAQIDADPQVQSSTLPLDQLYAAYLAAVFGPIDDTNKNKEAAAQAYLTALRSAGPGEARYDAVTDAFGPDAWDQVELAYTRRSSTAQGEVWRVDLTVGRSPAGHFSVSDTTGPWRLCQGFAWD